MSFDVKITTKWSFWDLLCPYKCRGCGAVGEILCLRCKNYMLQEYVKNVCPFCGKVGGACEVCNTEFCDIFVGGRRKDLLANLIAEYKYHSVRTISDVLVDVLDQVIPIKLQNVVVVPLPTIGRHIRERGFDHTWLLAKKLASRRGWQCESLLERASNTVQVGTKAKDRMAQASKTYVLKRNKLLNNANYLLLDDVWTTGASMISAGRVLKTAGVERIYGAVVVASFNNEEIENIGS